KQARALAEGGWLTCLGVRATHAETGYGYMRAGENNGDSGREIAAFVEKPDQDTARRYFESGDYLWNAGMFCFRADAILAALQMHAGDILTRCRKACSTSRPIAGQPSSTASALPAGGPASTTF